MAIICLLVCLGLCWVPGRAGAVSTADTVEPISPEKSCSLTLRYVCDGIAFENLPVKLYRIAAVSAEAQYTLTPQFRSSGLEINGIQTAGEWDVIRSSLEAHILAAGIAPDVESVTDAGGQACFAGLMPGLYLVAAVHTEQEGWHYSFRSALIALPGLDESGLWLYDMAATPKPDILPPSEPQELQFQVLKLWKDEGNEDSRPESIEVEIFRNGESCEIVTLSQENTWSYHWTAPADGAQWMVVERNIPEGYTVTVESRSTAFILTNSISKDPPPENPKTGDSTNILLAVVLLNLSGAGLILLGMFRKRFEV
jgi:LPXTG-motif cell wall-anchored protein